MIIINGFRVEPSAHTQPIIVARLLARSIPMFADVSSTSVGTTTFSVILSAQD